MALPAPKMTKHFHLCRNFGAERHAGAVGKFLIFYRRDYEKRSVGQLAEDAYLKRSFSQYVADTSGQCKRDLVLLPTRKWLISENCKCLGDVFSRNRVRGINGDDVQSSFPFYVHSMCYPLDNRFHPKNQRRKTLKQSR